MSFAVVNAKYNDPKSKAFDTRNVLVQGKKITGVGYIPDEDEEKLTIVDATKSVLLPGVSDFVFLPHLDSLDFSLNQLFEYGVQRVIYLPNSPINTLDNS